MRCVFVFLLFALVFCGCGIAAYIEEDSTPTLREMVRWELGSAKHGVGYDFHAWDSDEARAQAAEDSEYAAAIKIRKEFDGDHVDWAEKSQNTQWKAIGTQPTRVSWKLVRNRNGTFRDPRSIIIYRLLTRKVIHSPQTSMEAYHNAAGYHARGLWKEAIKWYCEAITMDNQNGDALAGFAYLAWQGCKQDVSFRVGIRATTTPGKQSKRRENSMQKLWKAAQQHGYEWNADWVTQIPPWEMSKSEKAKVTYLRFFEKQARKAIQYGCKYEDPEWTAEVIHQTCELWSSLRYDAVTTGYFLGPLRKKAKKKKTKRVQGRQATSLTSWSSQVRNRDNHSCQNCGDRTSEIHAHHIWPKAEYPERALDIDNGIALCEPCHEGTFGKEESLAPYFERMRR